MSSVAARPGAAGATTRTFTPSPRSATARRRINEPAASPSVRGNECVRNRPFICSEIVRRVAFPRQVFDARPQLAQLRALSGDHLSKESSCEQHAPYCHARLDEIHQRTKSNSADNAPQYGNDSDDHSDNEQRRAQHTKKEKRFSSKAKLEPDREHVQYADGNTPDSKLGLSSISRIKGHWNLRYGKSIGCRHHDHV